MIKTTMNSVLARVREDSKTKDKYFAEFLFLGGSVAIPVDVSQSSKLLPLVGRDLLTVFEVKPRSTVLFDRSISLFEVVRLLEFSEIK